MTEEGISFREEFRLKNFGFSYDKPYQFSVSEWRWPRCVYIAWRVFWPLWHLGWLARSIQVQATEDEGEKWFIYLTNWSFLVLTVQSVLHLAVVITSRCKGRTADEDFNEDTNTSILERVTWCFTAVSFDAAILVTIVYWAFIFKKLTKALSIMTHAVTTLYVIIDIFISASPFRLLHVIYGVVYGVIYGFFTVFYHLGDGTNNQGKHYVYDILDWSSPGMAAALMVGLIFAAIPIVHLFLFGLYTLKVFMSRRCGCGKKSRKNDEPIP